MHAVEAYAAHTEPRLDDQQVEGLVELRAVLDTAGYEEPAVAALVGRHRHVLGAVGAEHLARVRLGHEPVEILTRLFVVRTAVPREDVVRALGRRTLELLAALDLVDVDAATVAPRVEIALAHGLRIIGDLSHEPTAFDHVAARSHTTDVCAVLTVREPIDRALDLGCGAGVHALLAAAHAQHVVATDVNPRALSFTLRNAVLNGRDNLEVRLGDLYEPVRGERFGLIVCNAPYVVSPDHTFAFRDGPDSGDELTERVMRGVTEHLCPGAWATVSGSWIEVADESPLERIASWIGRDLDALVLPTRSLDPDVQAAAWNLPIEHPPDERFADAVERWSTHAADRGVHTIHEGAFVIRRHRTGSDRDGWQRVEPLITIRRDAVPVHVQAIFDNVTRLESMADDQLLDSILVLAPRTVLREHVRFLDDAVVTTEGRITTADGLEMEALVDPFTLDVLRRLDGHASLRTRLVEASCGHAEGLEAEAVAVAREMVASGLLGFR